MPIVTPPSGELHYVECGRGVPLVLLHANPGDSRDFEAIMCAILLRRLLRVPRGAGEGEVAQPHEVDANRSH
jgi:pimeloyl-ACP methyl ester carboxylesterase